MTSVTSVSWAERITSPSDLKKLNSTELHELAAAIRASLIESVSRTGGHIGPNLGVVELTIAMLCVFDLPKDHITWDVGHQTYVYKMLTGRWKFLTDTLRQDDGCCGFLHREESPYDAFGAGHAGTSISAALGMATARDLTGGTEKVLAVIGDGALGNGISLEALNQITDATRDFVLVINDNEMSISENVGALAKYLNRIIADTRYIHLRRNISNTISSVPLIGKPLHKMIHNSLAGTKRLIMPASLFENLGLRYIGPINGHNLDELIDTFEKIKAAQGPVVVHVLTEKGRGFEPAKRDPEGFHGLGKFDPATGKPLSANSAGVSFSNAFGHSICEIAEKDDKVVAITAGMCLGTGLDRFRSKFPTRLFDVGIAEEHAAIFAAGLATKKIKPVIAIYGTFMQRAVDCVYHDICIQDLPVVFCLDRAGIVADGPTHHGIYDLSSWLSFPNLSVMQPSCEYEMKLMLQAALDSGSPAIIRYPKANCPTILDKNVIELEWGKAAVISAQGTDAYIWTTGGEVETALKVQELLAEKGTKVTVVNTRFLQPFDKTLFATHITTAPVITIEDHVKESGLGALTDRVKNELNETKKCIHFGWPADEIICWGTAKGIKSKYGLLPAQIAETAANILNN